MEVWYTICEALPVEMLRWAFMKNALLAVCVMAPLFGLLSTLNFYDSEATFKQTLQDTELSAL